MKRKLFSLASLGLIPLFLLVLATQFVFTGNFEGIYLLKGTGWRLFEVRDDILLGEYERVLAKVEFAGLRSPSGDSAHFSTSAPYFKYKWNDKTGEGFITNFYPDGTKLLMAFSRFLDSEGREPAGLFIGGGLPYSEYDHEKVLMNETGMAYFNGADWLHIWCNANESISSIFSMKKPAFPSHWKFLGSKVIHDHNGELMLKSSHEIDLDGAPLGMDRFVYYRAGDKFLTLVIRITNIGKTPMGYYYVYGDEPWLGEFGSSAGNVGWTRNRIFNYEASVDTKKYAYAGMFDHGNSALPGRRYIQFTNIANFIQWIGPVQPDLVYFSNQIGTFADEKNKVPLSSDTNRLMFLQWGPRMLLPAQSESIILAIGMAGNDPKTGMPVKPALHLDKEYLEFIISHEN